MNRKHKLFYSIFFVLIVTALLYTGCNVQEEKKAMSQDELIARGEYLIETTGCHDCHTPKTFGPEGMKPDETKLLAGHPEGSQLYEIDINMVGPGKWTLTNDHLTAWVGPWGISFSSNLTPDNATGLGAVSEEMFIKTLREGKIKGIGRQMLPPMPYEVFGKMTDEDLKAMYAYLQSIPSVSNKVNEPVPPPMVAELYGKK
jgi:mono/diheme cytochrome c family protein